MAVIKHDSLKNSNLITNDRALSEKTIITLTKLEYDYELGRLGLRGTLMGACAAFALIVLMVFAPIITKKDIVEGWQLVWIVGLVAGAVMVYGAFVFNRALSLTGKVGESEVKVETRTSNLSSSAQLKQQGAMEEESDTVTIKSP